jgi:hypothetical protein
MPRRGAARPISGMNLDLKDVTICAVDSVHVALTARALNLSTAQCRFADVILFSHARAEGAFRIVEIDKINSTAEYSTFCWKELPKWIGTPFVLIVQWDGYVVNPGAWDPVFREFDYIGARWPFVTDGMNVGNGGFSLRSQRFLSALLESRFKAHDAANADWLVCRTYRPALESEFGIRFAPGNIADLFSHERVAPVGPTFGFHGLGSMWRYVEDTNLVRLVDLLDPYVYRTVEYSRLLLECFRLGKFELLAALFARMKAHVGHDEILHTMTSLVGASAGECVSLCESLLPQSSPEIPPSS